MCRRTLGNYNIFLLTAVLGGTDNLYRVILSRSQLVSANDFHTDLAIRRLAAQGVAIVVLSSEAQEIMRVCDRSLVMFHGRQVGEVSGEGMNEHNIMYLATGGNQKESERV